LASKWGVPFIVSSALLDSNVTHVFEQLIRHMERNSGLLPKPQAANKPSSCIIV
jgi:hypothetical protein